MLVQRSAKKMSSVSKIKNSHFTVIKALFTVRNSLVSLEQFSLECQEVIGFPRFATQLA